MDDSKISKKQAEELFPKLEYTKDGKIKDFSIPDAHTLFVKLYMNQTNELLKHEAIQLPSLDAIWALHYMTDDSDGYVYAKKWSLHGFVINEILSKGESQFLRPPFRYEYKIRKTKHASELKHLG